MSSSHLINLGDVVTPKVAESESGFSLQVLVAEEEPLHVLDEEVRGPVGHRQTLVHAHLAPIFRRLFRHFV